jgi:hypothetical protein
MPNPYSYEWLQQKSEENWSRVPEEKRAECVLHLREVIGANDLPVLRKMFEDDDFDGWFHFSGGMSVRNTLRDVMKDDELPGVKYDHLEGDHEYSNWDDYYMAALRQAIVPKDGEA